MRPQGIYKYIKERNSWPWPPPIELIPHSPQVTTEVQVSIRASGMTKRCTVFNDINQAESNLKLGPCCYCCHPLNSDHHLCSLTASRFTTIK